MTLKKTIEYVFRELSLPWWCYVTSIVLGLLVGFWRKKWTAGLLAAYLFFLLSGTVLTRTAGSLRYQLRPFWSYKYWRLHGTQIIANMLSFFPVGFLAGRMWKWRAVFFAVGVSVCIELLQLVTHTGLCELDDVMHNSVGGLVGVAAAVLLQWRSSVRAREKTINNQNSF